MYYSFNLVTQSACVAWSRLMLCFHLSIAALCVCTASVLCMYLISGLYYNPGQETYASSVWFASSIDSHGWCTCLHMNGNNSYLQTCLDMTKLYGYDRMMMVQCLIKAYIESTQSRIVIVIYKHIYSNVHKYINFNISKVKRYREYEQYDSVLCSLMWFKYIKRKSSDMIRYTNVHVQIET